MQTLILMRHAKSEGPRPGGGDFDRGLNQRGLEGAALMGSHLRERGLVPEQVLCSPARRAKETLECLGEGFSDCPAVDFFDDLYLASPGTLFSRMADVKVDVGSLLVVAHNPGIEDAAVELAQRGPGDPGALTSLAGGFVTAALAVFEIEGQGFADAAHECARLVHFASPKTLA